MQCIAGVCWGLKMIDITNEFCAPLKAKIGVNVEPYAMQQPLLGVAKWFTEFAATEEEALCKIQDAISHYYKECESCQKIIIGTCVRSYEQGQHNILVSVLFNHHLKGSVNG